MLLVQDGKLSVGDPVSQHITDAPVAWKGITIRHQLATKSGRTQVYHGGGGPGARASFTRFLEDRLSIIVLINMDDVDVDTIVQGLATLHLPKTQR